MSEQSTLPALPVQVGVEFRHCPQCTGYCVGSDGTVWSCWARRGRPKGRGIVSYLSGRWKGLRCGIRRTGQTRGRRYINILRNGERRTTFVYRLVLEAFVGPRPEGMECRHLDGNRANDRLDNLCWGTQSQNVEDQRRHGTTPQGTRNPAAKLCEVDVRRIRSLLAQGRLTLLEIGDMFGVSFQLISQIKRGLIWAWVRDEENPRFEDDPPVRGVRR